MTNSSQHTALNIDARHVKQQFDRRGDLSSAEFLHGEIAQRMLDRLKLIKHTPQTILDAGCGSGRRMEALMQRYPSATRLIGQDHSDIALGLIKQPDLKKGWEKLLAKFQSPKSPVEYLQTDLAHSTLPPESIDLVWSNLAMHWHPEPHNVLREWGRIIRSGGLAFFSSYGPSTLKELREALIVAGLHTHAMPFVDMHDFGDLLIENGFADPVMDQETLTLTYKNANDLLRDVVALGGNAAQNRRRGLTTRHWLQQLMAALEAKRNDAGLITLTIEVAYGHAWRSHTLKRGNETRISLGAIKRPK